MNRVYIIDDEQAICESISLILEDEGYSVAYSTNGTAGLQRLQEEEFDVIFVDIQIPDIGGFEILHHAREKKISGNFIVISAFGNIQNAVKATKLGAFDFLEKPIDRDKLLICVRNACAQANLSRENAEMKSALYGGGAILGNSSGITTVLDMIGKAAPTDVRVLITGENGTGKELVARALHNNSSRAGKPFIDVNCAAIPNELIESELFGHEKGSFTGAVQQRTGKFELAHRGTLFLDEIGDMSLQAQAKVLRAIEDGKIERVGGGKKIEVDVRIVAATNKNLTEEIEKGNFREDLYHRLNVIPIHLPPLRERKDDIPLLVNAFSRDISGRYKKPCPVFSADAMLLLQSLQWPGNIRELRNILERIVIIVNKGNIERRDIEFLLPYEKASLGGLIEESNSFQDFKEKAEKAFILKQLEANNWNISKTAELLDIQRSHLYNKMKKYGIEKEGSNE